MPDFQLHQFKLGKSKIYLLEFFESFDPENYLDQLSDHEKERYFSFLHLKRKKEYVATRVLKHSIFGYQEIKYEAHGAPYIERHEYISISHASNLVGIAVNLEFQVGLDIELIHPKVLSLHSKFMSESEQKFFDLSAEKELIACWSMKEVLYKLSGKKELDFKNHLCLEKKGETEFIGKIVGSAKDIQVNLHIFEFKNYIVSINTGKMHEI